MRSNRAPRWVVTAMLIGGVALASPAAAMAGYEKVDTDSISVKSADGQARAYGSVYWYKDCNLLRCIRRGDYSKRASVRALKPVGCLWAKVHYTYVGGGFDISPGGPGGSFSTGTFSQDGYYSSCHTAVGKRPKALRLYGVGYPKFALLSTTLDVCTSERKKDGPRFCGHKKMWYPIGSD